MKRPCQRCREELAARDAGALSALEQARVDVHLERCPACRAFRATLAGALDAARAFRPAPTPEERDALYAAIRRQPAARTPVASRRGWWVHVAAAAALALVAEPRRPPPRGEAAAYERVQPAPELELLLAPGSSWRVAIDATPWRLTLERGEVFVRFHGRPGLELRADAPGVEVWVSGTVFKLATTPAGSEVGVLEGHVTVRAPSGASASLVAGQLREPSGTVRPLSDGDPVVARALTAPARARDGGAAAVGSGPLPVAAAKEDTVAAAPSSPPPPTVSSPRPAPSSRTRPRPTRSAVDAATDGSRSAAPSPASPPATVDAAQLYAGAESAMRAGDLATAAAALEAVLRSPAPPAVATSARLDLARLYAGPLDRRSRAVALLREILAAAPSPSDAQAARLLLCRLDAAACTNSVGRGDPQGKGGTP